MHGKVSGLKLLNRDESILFQEIQEPMKAGRYHSLAVSSENLPPQLMVTAVTEDGEIMAVEDQKNNVYGVQFHPESILTENGAQLIKNIIKRVQ